MNEGRSPITFEAACDAWATSRNVPNAHTLLQVGLQYWNDDMIGDETFSEEVVKPVMQYLGLLKETFRKTR